MNKDIKMLERLRLPEGKIDLVIDTDAYNEIDDQFAIVYALKLVEKLNVRALYACPFYKPEYNFRSTSAEDGMIKSYEEIIRLLKLLGRDSEGFVFKGAKNFLSDTQKIESNEAVEHLIKLAMTEYTTEKPLTVMCIGALTNVATALKIEPKLADHIEIVWLGGPVHSYNKASEFNLHQDIISSQFVFDTEVPLVQIPCFGVASHLLTSIFELRECMDLTKEVNAYLYESFKAYNEDHFGYNKEIWDIAPLAYLINPEEFTTSFIIRRPKITLDETYSVKYDSHFMRVIQTLNRNALYKNMFTVLNR